MGIGVTTSFAITPQLNKNIPYAGISAVDPIGELNAPVLTLAVKDSSPIRDLQDFVSTARDQPGGLQVASPGKYTATELIFNDFMVETNIDVNVIPYTGGGPANTAVLSGEVDAAVSSAGAIKGLVDAGQLRNIGIISRLNKNDIGVGDMSELPTRRSGGYGRGLPYTQILFAPKNLREDARDELLQATHEIVTSDEWERFAESTYMPVAPKSPKEVVRDYQEQAKMYLLKKRVGE